MMAEYVDLQMIAVNSC